MTQNILNIALDVPLDRLFDYLGDGFDSQIGQRVVVGFAGRKLVGIVVGKSTKSEVAADKLKSILEVFDDDTALDSPTFKLLKFCADYYQTPYGQALISVLPARLRQIKPAVSRKQFAYSLNDLGKKSVGDLPPRKALLKRLVSALLENVELSESSLGELSTGWRKAINELEQMGWLNTKQILATNHIKLGNNSIEPTLNNEQQYAINAILESKNSFKPWLLHGITGSGKTEVYMRLMQSVLNEKDGQALAQVLVLVPEINLTPQLEARFRSRLPQYTLVCLHSNLSESERLQNWLLAKSGIAQIIIGTRLSVFTPLPKLKLIIIDEEHDNSYKQQEGMRYHARDVAIVRAQSLKIPVVLGSATPALESWFNAQAANSAISHSSASKYGLLTLNQRAVAQSLLPKIRCIDVRKSPTQDGLSPLLIEAMRERLNRGEQSLLFINRRGYAPVLHCNACHWIAPCMRCSSKLVVHLSQQRLRCHYCGHEQKIPLQCPSCGNADLHPTGQGTQRLEQTLGALFPTARIARVDRDSTRNKNALTDILTAVHNGEIDILVGTQMLAKGHDFPNLTLVGVIDTDSALFSPDFRAAERLFAQLIQVAGRAGRADKAGEVVVQTKFPHHALFDALRNQDYTAYVDNLLQERESTQFPPYAYFALIRAEAHNFNDVSRLLNSAALAARQQCSQENNQVLIYDPVRPQMERLKGMERGQLLIQASERLAIQKLLRKIVPQLRADKSNQKIRWSVDVDPLEF
ncbi:MAG: primosomal protein N' [Methylophilaceae bacterium]|nr:primosomal protein N' [Methylophilaceae bacterium]